MRECSRPDESALLPALACKGENTFRLTQQRTINLRYVTLRKVPKCKTVTKVGIS